MKPEQEIINAIVACEVSEQEALGYAYGQRARRFRLAKKRLLDLLWQHRDLIATQLRKATDK